jgi:hypothetical protein
MFLFGFFGLTGIWQIMLTVIAVLLNANMFSQPPRAQAQHPLLSRKEYPWRSQKLFCS